jgi:ribosomal protein S18 acetylase RimI-like enzyme
MLGLVQELANYEREPNAVTVTLAEMEEAGFGENPNYFAWVVLVDDNIVGFALCYIRYSTWKGKMVYLEDFYVQPAFRKLGLGKLLFDTVVQYSQENKYKGLTWQVLEWNELAINFYKKYNANLDPEWVNGKIMF